MWRCTEVASLHCPAGQTVNQALSSPIPCRKSHLYVQILDPRIRDAPYILVGRKRPSCHVTRVLPRQIRVDKREPRGWSSGDNPTKGVMGAAVVSGCRFLGVAQSGQSFRFGSEVSLVRIQPPRPFIGMCTIGSRVDKRCASTKLRAGSVDALCLSTLQHWLRLCPNQ